jgi:hypothetical protein
MDFVDKMTGDLAAKNPQLAQAIRDWFSRKQQGKPFSEGLERVGLIAGGVKPFVLPTVPAGIILCTAAVVFGQALGAKVRKLIGA